MSARWTRSWTTGEVLAEVRKLIADQVGLDLDEVTPASNLRDDLGTDSLDDIEILMAVEEAFGLEDLPEEKTKTVRTVHQLAAVAAEQLGKRVVAG